MIRLMKNTAVLILTTAALPMLMTAQGQAVQMAVLDFEQLSTSPPDMGQLFGFVHTPYYEDGFVIESQPGSFLRSIHPPSHFYAGSIAVFNDYLHDSTTLREGNGRPFQLVSIRLSRLVNSDVTLFFTGLTSSGAIVTTSFFRDGLSDIALTTEFFPPSFNNLLEVRWEQDHPGQSSGAMQVDDLTLIFIPEPSSCLLLLLAMLSGNFCRRR